MKGTLILPVEPVCVDGEVYCGVRVGEGAPKTS